MLPFFSPMRIALFVKTKRHTRTTRSIRRALERAGHTLAVINEGKRRRRLGPRLARASALRAVRRLRPHFVFVHAQDASREVFGALAAEFRTVMFTPDCWESPVRPDRLGLAAQADLLCTVAKGQLAEFERAGVARVAHLAEACDPDVYFPVEEAPARLHSDAAFIGKYSRESPLHATRGALVSALAPHLDLALYGRGWRELGLRPRADEVFPRRYRQICRGARIVLGCDWRNDCEGYFSNRTWFTLGCRGFLLTNYVPGLEQVFENHGHLVWYRSPEEALDLARHYLARPEERARIAARGHAYVRAHRTYDHFARDLLTLVTRSTALLGPRREIARVRPRPAANPTQGASA